jgi:CO dehydrogenase/acetyl-CoA synthase delta subunit
MCNIKEYDIVKSTKDLNNKVLKGCEGTVLIVYDTPTLGYEVEFVNDANETLAVLTVYPDDIYLILPFPK